VFGGLAGKVAVVTGRAGGLASAVVSVDGGAAITSTVRPSGGAGAGDSEPLDRRTYLGGGSFQ
jgi:hypothetical protein